MLPGRSFADQRPLHADRRPVRVGVGLLRADRRNVDESAESDVCPSDHNAVAV